MRVLRSLVLTVSFGLEFMVVPKLHRDHARDPKR